MKNIASNMEEGEESGLSIFMMCTILKDAEACNEWGPDVVGGDKGDRRSDSDHSMQEQGVFEHY